VAVAVDEIGEPGRAAGRCDERVEPILGQCLVDPFVARNPATLCERVTVCGALESAALCSHRQQFLAEVRHLPVAVPLVECDQVIHRTNRRGRRELRQVLRKPCLEFVQQHFEFGLRKTCARWKRDRVDDLSTRGFHRLQCTTEQRLHTVVG